MPVRSLSAYLRFSDSPWPSGIPTLEEFKLRLGILFLTIGQPVRGIKMLLVPGIAFQDQQVFVKQDQIDAIVE